MKKRKTKSLHIPKEDNRTAEEIAMHVEEQLKALRDIHAQREFDAMLAESVERLVTNAKSGTRADAQRILFLAMECTGWLAGQVREKNPVVLELAESVPGWPCLVYPHQAAIELPPSIASQYEALDLAKLLKQMTVPRQVAYRLLRIVDKSRKLVETENFCESLENMSAELKTLGGDYFPDIATYVEGPSKLELGRWQHDVETAREGLMVLLAELAQYLDTENPLADAAVRASYCQKCHELPEMIVSGADDAWWR